MAEKKFFVDINLQGSALTNAKIGTNTGIGSTEGAFGYDSAAHRLQYFDGTATKDVANLSDIAAVTGGLIFQGGYDPTTNTPDITDGTAFKGFFWAVTAAGDFLGESVQVGDSIVAKVDNAGTTLSDWLILQGNIVIATDTVDGISRLATQTEANDGTESGAVVITPATLQGKIDAQVTPAINDKLSKTGGTMSGALDMGNNNINNVDGINAVAINTTILSGPGNDIALALPLNTQGNAIINLPAPTDGGDATNKTYVDDQDALKLSLTGGTMSGTIVMGGNNIAQAGAVVANELEGSIVYTNTLQAQNGDEITLINELNLNSNAITNLPAPTANGDATNKTYVDNADALKLDLAGGTMSGNIDMGMNEVTNLNAVRTQEVSNEDGSLGFTWDGGSLSLYGSLNNKITNLTGAPTDGTDATNKTYVDGVGATAVNDANEYTDTAISQEVTDRNNAIKAQSFSATILSDDWTFDNTINSWYAVVSHNLGNYITISSFYDGAPAEFAGELSGNDYYLRSNSQPSESTVVNIVKAGGNL
jgi:hypothetical protein